ncbi:MAG: hypothetical protein P1U40_09365 [Coxiellaceae bacterium]|nr:hypothetical protein [Coxiellaceae bacterium]
MKTLRPLLATALCLPTLAFAATTNPTLFILNNGTIPSSVTAPHYLITGYKVSNIEFISKNGKKVFGPTSNIISPHSGLHIDPYSQALNVKYDGSKINGNVNIIITTIDSVNVKYKNKRRTVNCIYSKATVSPVLNVNTLSLSKDPQGKLICFVTR